MSENQYPTRATQAQACKILNISLGRLERLVNQGKIEVEEVDANGAIVRYYNVRSYFNQALGAPREAVITAAVSFGDRGSNTGQTESDRLLKVVPSELAEAYEFACSNPDLLSTYPQMAYAKAVIEDLVRTSARHDSPQAWNKLKELWEAFCREFDPDVQAQLKKDIRKTIEEGVGAWAIRDEINSWIGTASRLQKGETQRLKAANKMISTDTLTEFNRIYIEVLSKNVPEPHLSACFRELQIRMSSLNVFN